MKTTSQLDLGNLEDLFFCIDVLTQARSALHGSYPKLAHNLGLITDSIMDFTAQHESSPKIIVHGPEAIPPVRRQGHTPAEDAITDVLTGEIIAHGT